MPTYANPTGAVYTEEVTRALVSMPTAAADFRIFWDNPYAVHHLTDAEHPALDVLGLGRPGPATETGCSSSPPPRRSPSPAPGSPSSPGPRTTCRGNLKHLGKRTIGPDKVDHLRHARYLGSADGVRELMRKHRAIHPAQVPAGGGDPRGTARRPRGGDLDEARGVTASACRCSRRLCDPGRRPGQGGGDRDDRSGRRLPVRQGPARSQHPDRPGTSPTPDDVAAAIGGLCTCVLLAATEQRLARD